MLSLSPAWRRTGHLWLGLLRASAGPAPSVRRNLYVSLEWSRRSSSAAATDPSHSSSVFPEHVTIASEKYLSRHARGVKRWEEAKEKAAEEEIDFEVFCNRIIEILKVNRYTKASNLTKIYDLCTSVDELNKAEEVLKSFRCSWSRPTPALPLVLVRACLRLGQSQRALQYVREKVQFGVFPSRRVYHILMDAFIAEGDAAGALATFQQMQEDELVCDEVTHFLATKAHLMLNTPEGLHKAISLSRQCFQSEPRLRSKCSITVITTLLKQGRHREAEETLAELEKDGTLLPQTHLNLLTHTLVSTGQLDRALSLLKHRLCPSSNTGQHLTDPGQLTSDLGQQASDSGQQVSNPGQQGRDLEQQVSNPGQQASDLGQQARDLGQQVSDLGQLSSDPGQLTSDPGQLTGDAGQQNDDLGQLSSDQGLELGLPHMAWPELCSAIKASGNEALSQQLEELKEELKINGKIHE